MSTSPPPFSAASASADTTSHTSHDTTNVVVYYSEEAFRQARQKQSYCAMVCGRPYLPHTSVRLQPQEPLNDEKHETQQQQKQRGRDSVVKVVECIFQQLLVLIQQEQRGDHTHNTSSSSSSSNSVLYSYAFPFSIPVVLSSSEYWSVEPVHGGTTNKLFRVILHPACSTHNVAVVPSSSSSSVLVRVFGAAAGMIDRDHETCVFAQLAHARHAPAYYGRFGNGRVEGWCESPPSPSSLHTHTHTPPYRVLTQNDLNDPLIRRAIAQTLARLHGTFRLIMSSRTNKPSLWPQLESWCESAQRVVSIPNNKHDNGTTTPAQTRVLQSLHLASKIPAEIAWLKDTITTASTAASSISRSRSSSTHDAKNKNKWKQMRPKNHIAFCHNDLLASNILYQPPPPPVPPEPLEHDDDHDTATNSNHTTITIQLIDFEYGGMNYTAFDMANHWNEYAGGPPHTAVPDYTLFPSYQSRRDFIATYLRTLVVLRKQNHHDEEEEDSAAEEEEAEEEALEHHIQSLLDETNLFVLANHLYWGLWGINQAGSEGTHAYDYLTYGQKRIEQYWIGKKELLQLQGQGQ